MSLNPHPLADKVAIVTGGRRGIGQAIALAFVDAGADVAICDIVTSDGELEKTAEYIRQAGRRCITAGVDTRQKEQVDAFVEKVAGHYGRIDIVVSNAGVGNTIQAYKGFAVPRQDVKDGKVLFYFTVSDPSTPSIAKTLEFYIPEKYMQKTTEPPVAVPAIISLDMITINAGACISILKDNTPECVVRFDQ